jgi:pimeloyl-ACP methyl ester carboxylesterase
VPLILTHGWPWTFWDFERVIRPLADPGAFGGDPADAFDVVVPSLPGFGFSSPLGVTGIGPFQTADLWVRLMRDVLGYDRFAAQGGDWGAIVTAQLGHAHADSLLGVHLSLPALLGGVLGRLKAEDYGPGEEGWYEQMQTRMAQTAASHLAVHRLDPQTLAWACHDSPVGLAAWILERRRNWSDCDGDVERRFSKDDLLTTMSIYWFTETFVSSVRYYREALLAGWRPAHDRRPRIEAPTAIAVFPRELILVPRSVAAQESDLRRWTVMPSGGHFAPAEEPELLVEDIRASFRPLR